MHNHARRYIYKTVHANITTSEQRKVLPYTSRGVEPSLNFVHDERCTVLWWHLLLADKEQSDTIYVSNTMKQARRQWLYLPAASSHPKHQLQTCRYVCKAWKKARRLGLPHSYDKFLTYIHTPPTGRKFVKGYIYMYTYKHAYIYILDVVIVSRHTRSTMHEGTDYRQSCKHHLVAS